MKSNRALSAVMIVISSLAWGCQDDVGSCDDPLKGQDTVLVMGQQIQYAGQAIINVSCAKVCHSSTAHGNDRHGAPAGLDFDVFPISETDQPELVMGTQTDSKGRTVVRLTDAAVASLRDRQRKIFEKRNEIWTQVKEGLMPPGGAFKSFWSLVSIKDSDEATPCTASTKSFLPINTKPSQDLLRNWLACNVPIVEVQGPDVGVNGVPGSAGYQYLSCSGVDTNPGDGGVGDGGTDGGQMMSNTVTLDDLLAGVFASCASCHPALNPGGVKIDFSSVDMLYSTMVSDTSTKCSGKPYVTPGDPSNSWLIDVLSSDQTSCRGTVRMPQGGPYLGAADMQRVEDWITQGAKRASDLTKSNPASGGLDAGL